MCRTRLSQQTRFHMERVVQTTCHVMQVDAVGKVSWDQVTPSCVHQVDTLAPLRDRLTDTRSLQQGKGLSTEEAAKAMRHHPQVITALEAWWDTAMAGIRAEGRTDRWLCRDDYVSMSMSMCA